ncbi:MAG: 4-alpha-glucanotransferase, partial [Ilumatobacter sp.]
PGGVDLPDGLPVGCHTLRIEADGHVAECLVVVAPSAMPGFDPVERSSCLFAPAYSLWEHDEPLPSFRHLARLADRMTRFGVDMVATLPLYAAFLDQPFDPSPYSPISRLHWNEVYLSDAGLPAAPLPDLGDDGLGGDVDWRELAARRRRQLLRAALDADDLLVGELDRFRAAHPDVGSFARFMASRESGGDLVVERSHVLAQYLADRELSAIGHNGSASLSLDLPIGSHPEGWETWAHPQLFATSMSVGAPPDTFFTEGQNWGFSPQLPAAIRQSGYELWRQMIARAGRYCDLLRIDHVMAVHRLWWVPEGQSADRGVYVRYPHDELLAVIAAEAAVAGVGIVGENLGTVPPEVDAALDAWNVLGMHEEQFHLDGPDLAEIPARSVAGVRTHDMAPFAAVVDDPANAETTAAYRDRLGAATPADQPLLDAVITRLGASDAQIVVVDLDDLVDETRPHNLPGRVVDGIWRRRLDRPTSETLADDRVVRRLELLGRTPS